MIIYLGNIMYLFCVVAIIIAILYYFCGKHINLKSGLLDVVGIEGKWIIKGHLNVNEGLMNVSGLDKNHMRTVTIDKYNQSLDWSVFDDGIYEEIGDLGDITDDNNEITWRNIKTDKKYIVQHGYNNRMDIVDYGSSSFLFIMQRA